MASSEERMQILKMVQEGKISAAEAAQLLTTLEDIEPRPRSAAQPSTTKPQGRWLRVRVTDMSTGKVRANIRLPLSMVGPGIKMGMRFSPEMDGLDPEMLSQLIASGEMGQIVDVTDEVDGEHVEVFIE